MLGAEVNIWGSKWSHWNNGTLCHRGIRHQALDETQCLLVGHIHCYFGIKISPALSIISPLPCKPRRVVCHQVFPTCLFSLRYFEPFQLFVGATVVTLLFLGFVWAAENQAPIRRFRRNHPSVAVLAILLASYLFISVLGGVAVFLFGIAFPILSETGTHTHKPLHIVLAYSTKA